MNKNKKLITIEEFKNTAFPTISDKAEYKASLKVFEQENEQQILLELGQQMKEAREKAGFTQEQLAKEIKTSKGNVSRMEHGKQNFTVEYIIKVAQTLKRPVRIEIL
jgi:ribosome-binding protein aMBF1 (putative translation factor)